MAAKKKQRKKKKAASRSRSVKSRSARTAARAAKNAELPSAVLDSGKLKQLYSAMLECRLFVEESARISPGCYSLLGNMPGHEAVLVGAVSHALPADIIFISPVAALASYIRRAPLDSILADLTERHEQSKNESNRGGARPHTLAEGIAVARKRGSAGVIFVFTGSGPAGPASGHYEMLAEAAREKLPLICVAETGPAFEWIAERQRASAAPGSHFPEILVDGSDVVAVFRVVQEAARRARTGHGPCLIHCIMPGSSQSTAVGEPAAAAENHSPDPLKFMEHYLKRKALWTEDLPARIRDDFRKNFDAALAVVKNSPASALSFHS